MSTLPMTITVENVKLAERRGQREGAQRQVQAVSFDRKTRTVQIRWGAAGLYDFSLVNGQGLKGSSEWAIVLDDLRELRAAAAAVDVPSLRSGLRKKKERTPRRAAPTLDDAQRRNLDMFDADQPIPFGLTEKGARHASR